MTETGTVQVEHHQFLLAATDTTAVTGEGNLIWAAPGFVTVLTGIAHGPATLTLDSTDEADTATEDWEVVEETVIDSPEPLRVIGLDEHVPPAVRTIPPGRWRVRVHARGRDTHPDLDVTEPAETYLITLTPTTDPTGTITTLTTGHADGGTASRIPVIDYEQVWVPTQEGGYRAVHRDSPEAHAVYATRGRWGGRPPTGAILDDPAVRNAASAVADIDRNLLDAITALPPQQQFALARRCARWAFERAGLSRIPDFGKALDALDEGREPPAGLANHSLSYHRLATDPTIELTLVPGFGARSSIVPQVEAIATYEYARLADPL
ncbi:hypothetical protein IU443_29440 [Nocardia farcinica]|uniref:hypothetical protein n=1 Tax=Nocardia farcinica TaxID=37329 RepID=UPI001892FF20|nr:hypothetical protein [Nocardia farcinica]MBF6265968.1 hypothetical protein [Nocardia farcinica]MBF6284510.1 hypothetical protein [Nocardia farcinica]MBF6308979.1 hypothetical protein [Nocardia farcinica]MBF6394058.1 hypothetical protein [Nocardia farcinica]MBF6567179.1 hypothetical protein [Nocardia farcinica]